MTVGRVSLNTLSHEKLSCITAGCLTTSLVSQLCDYCAAAALSLCCVSQVFEECHCVGPPSIHWSLTTAPVCFCSSHLCPPLKQVWQEVYIICTKHCLIVTRTCGKTWAGLESLMKNWPSSFKCLNLHQNDFLFCIWAQTTNWVITYINVKIIFA